MSKSTDYHLPENQFPARMDVAVRELRIAVKALDENVSAKISALQAEVHDLAERVEPIESEIDADRERQKDREKRTALVEELRAAGIPIPEGFEGDPVTGVHGLPAPAPRLGWLREALELAATPGGTRVLGVFGLVLLGPDAVHLASSLVDLWKEPTPIVVPLGNNDDDGVDPALPDQGPPLPRYDGLQDDSPVTPRPNL